MVLCFMLVGGLINLTHVRSMFYVLMVEDGEWTMEDVTVHRS